MSYIVISEKWEKHKLKQTEEAASRESTPEEGECIARTIRGHSNDTLSLFKLQPGGARKNIDGDACMNFKIVHKRYYGDYSMDDNGPKKILIVIIVVIKAEVAFDRFYLPRLNVHGLPERFILSLRK